MKTRPKIHPMAAKQQIDHALYCLREVERETGTITDISALSKYTLDDYLFLPELSQTSFEWLKYGIEAGILRMDRRVIPFAHHYADHKRMAKDMLAFSAREESGKYLDRFMARLVSRFGPEGARDWLLNDDEPATPEQNRVIVEHYRKAVKAANDAKP